jgi:predicted AlkP superfamily pyrophosphatase or phosphodiesterase
MLKLFSHWTLVTGRYVESHGIVGNVVYYPEYDKTVRLGTTTETKYWNKTEPICNYLLLF